MAVMVEQFLQRLLELIEYLRIICYAANSTTGLAWVVYDNQFRTQVAKIMIFTGIALTCSSGLNYFMLVHLV